MFYKQYKLDRFQEEAIKSIEQNRSVIVAAPTGAGKTLIAEYAVEKYLKAGEQIIYTAPIKALSNQKYRDFSRDYGDKVGIITGDVVIDPNAPALIMTTEIFRNTIFDDPESLSDIGYVIFDEIHFIDDVIRGTVWEESIIFAPQHINFICLSATIPNLEVFANWMNTVRGSRIDVISEFERPVPLEHKLYIKDHGLGWLNELKEIQDNLEMPPTGLEWQNGRGTREPQDRWTTAKTRLMPPVATGIGEIAGNDIIEHIQLSDQLPCLYFSFSRGACEQKAMENIHRDFLTPHERETILEEFHQLCEKYGILNDPSAESMRELIEHGVAYHHAGMLPTIKEVIERLFTAGLIKLLFTTETFALGINMPACTVVFDSMAKFDGLDFRPLKAREYHQMAGRAGRRGIDTQGFVYACVDLEFNDYEDVAQSVAGEIEPIESRFSLAYSCILNLYQRHNERIYEVCEKSLGNYQDMRMSQEINDALKRAEQQKHNLEDALVCNHGADIKEIWDYKRMQERMGNNNRGTHQNRFGTARRNTESMIIQTMRCHKCEDLKNCMKIAQEIESLDNLVSELSGNLNQAEDYNQEQVKRRLEILRKIALLCHNND
jgi:superfamily II RNA helicase